MLRSADGLRTQPNIVVLASRTLRSSPESGARDSYDGAKRKQRFKLHVAFDTWGRLLEAVMDHWVGNDQAAGHDCSQALPV